VITPKLGESIVEGTVNAWLKQEGDGIEEYEGLLDVETDKVTTEVPSPADGDLFRPTEMVFSKRDEETPSQKPREPMAVPGKTMPLSPMRKRIAEHMQESKRTAPHVTTVMEADTFLAKVVKTLENWQ
jgi:pyruvate/2-oxoglutarate dehydrogenase complex dihydrolipoamide acyltransferase (E2) component